MITIDENTRNTLRNIAEGLGIDLDQVHVKASSMDGNYEIAKLEGIEARVIVSLWVDV